MEFEFAGKRVVTVSEPSGGGNSCAGRVGEKSVSACSAVRAAHRAAHRAADPLSQDCAVAGVVYSPVVRPPALGPIPTLAVTSAEKAMLLSADPSERKGMPVVTGVLDYFPLAIAEIARLSKAGNDQHNPGQPLHWSRDKSTDHADCMGRHLIDRGTRDTDGQRHSAKLAWRALANLQIELEQEAKK